MRYKYREMYRFWSRVDRSGDCWLWVGYLNANGYGLISLFGKNVLAHRVTYELAYQTIPVGMMVDHKCHVRHCVKPEHLRLASAKQNAENLKGSSSNSKSGVLGVSWDQGTNKWRAQVCHNRKSIYVGIYPTIHEAEAAVIAKRRELFTHNDLDRIEGVDTLVNVGND